MPGITYPYNLCGIKVPGYTTSSTEAEGETLLRYLVTRGVLSSNSNDSNLAFKKQTYKGCLIFLRALFCLLFYEKNQNAPLSFFGT